MLCRTSYACAPAYGWLFALVRSRDERRHIVVGACLYLWRRAVRVSVRRACCATVCGVYVYVQVQRL